MLRPERSRAGSRSNTAAGVSLLLALLCFASPAAAQSTTLALSGNIITFPAPTATDYVNGFVYSSGVLFTVDATSNSGQANMTTVAIKSTSANLGNGKVLADLQWRRSDLATWNTITLANVNVEARSQTFNGANDPWSNTIFFRMKLTWTTDAPATYTANYTITLSVQ
ncbi:MAG TPA: hypothetical protein VGO33_02110 [Gemmatimonadaceae bacterium]|nr:hypothetical protein [Gemmatimonadaceae bacterium]